MKYHQKDRNKGPDRSIILTEIPEISRVKRSRHHKLHLGRSKGCSRIFLTFGYWFVLLAIWR